MVEGNICLTFYAPQDGAKKSHRFAAYIVGCITAMVIVALITVFSYLSISKLTQYRDFSINLLDLIEFEASQ